MKPFGLIEKAFFLKKVKIFADLDLELLLAIAEKLHLDEYDKGDPIFTAGHAANRIYLLVQGDVSLIDEKSSQISELTSGDVFGDEALFSEGPRAYAAFAKTDAVLLTLSRSHLLSIISECPSVAVSLLGAYANHIPCRHRILT